MVFTAHRPHPRGKKTWFGYWRDDGFVKTKHRGRIDLNGTWPETKNRWVNSFRSRDVDGYSSVMREVGPSDEWCAEAYLATNYSAVDQTALVEAAKRYLIKGAMLLHEGRSAER